MAWVPDCTLSNRVLPLLKLRHVACSSVRTSALPEMLQDNIQVATSAEGVLVVGTASPSMSSHKN